MIIKPYGDIPRTYAPDIGEVIQARRTAGDRFVRAVVLNVRRFGAEKLQLRVQWLEDDPHAGVAGHPLDTKTGERVPIVAHTIGWVTQRLEEGAPPLIRQVDGGASR